MQRLTAWLLSSQVVHAFKILTSDKQVKAILVNIFGASALAFATPAPRGCCHKITTRCLQARALYAAFSDATVVLAAHIDMHRLLSQAAS